MLNLENKRVASWELVIINDKYAVRVDEVYADIEPESPTQNAPAPAGQQAQPAPAQKASDEQAPQAANGEEFNYDDFDIEDEDI